MSKTQTRTPMMRQYDQAKAACGDALLLFRMGDFYELFGEDAQIAASTLGLTLTSREKGENAIPMAGFPHHQLDNYLAKLIKAGRRVGVCEQVQDPREAKGLVDRQVTRVVSPGTVTDHELLDPRESNFLVAIVPGDRRADGRRFNTDQDRPPIGLAWIDLSTSAFFATVVDDDQAPDLLSRLAPSEVLLADDADFPLPPLAQSPVITRRPAWTMGLKHAMDLLLRQFQVASLEGFGFATGSEPAVRAAGAALQYVRETQNSSLEYIDRLACYRCSDSMEIDHATWRSLEISRTIRNHQRSGSLFDVIDKTVTGSGARLLGAWLAQPLTSRTEIAARQDAVQEFVAQTKLRRSVREYLKGTHDVQRLLGRITTGRASPRDLASICRTLQTLPNLKARLSDLSSRWLQQIHADLDPCELLYKELNAALDVPCPMQAKEGGFINDGYDARLDELRQLAAGGKQWIANYQAEISTQCGIPNLKVGYNKVFGYYLEVTHLHRDKVPESFHRKQTLKNAERFITPELKEYEERVLTADQQAIDLEYDIFCRLRDQVRQHAVRLKSNSMLLAQLDVLSGLAELASQHQYVRPEMVDDSLLEIVDGRHPVLDITEPLGSFVPNDARMDVEGGMIQLITGPNMAGKSTYIRQVALIVLLSHVGSFVPAKRAKIGITDKLFARVGASDELSRGQSTFMVEMTETARILNNATSRSLVILDEIGRGTSTYDGVSLAWAIVEFLYERIGCRTLFATHYHELTKLAETMTGVENYNVHVKEWEDQIVFLHKIVPGAADRSYGIHVARLAGVPNWVNGRAEKILQQLESSSEPTLDSQSLSRNRNEIQLTLFGPTTHPLVEKIQQIDTDEVTPMHALQMLQHWQKELREDSKATQPNT